jgi:TatD DNase family protein
MAERSDAVGSADPTGLTWADSHCHLDPTGDVAAVVAGASAAGVRHLVNVGTDVASSAQAIAVAAGFAQVWATAGVHPHDASGGIDGLEDLVGSGDVVAVGECGLDYHYDHSPRPVQKEIFAAQVALAHQYRLPLVIHTREAWDDTFDVLAAGPLPDVVIMHCFTGGPTEARRCLEVGAYLSFSGIVTFPSATDVRQAAGLCPIDRLLVETDSPYLAPVPHRGRTNVPALVPVVGAEVARVRDADVAAIAHSTLANTETAFSLA